MGTPVPTPMPTRDGHRHLRQREAARRHADEAAGEAEDGDDLAARAFEEVGEFRQRRAEGGVGAGIGGAGAEQEGGRGYDIVAGAAEPGAGQRELHGEHREGLRGSVGAVEHRPPTHLAPLTRRHQQKGTLSEQNSTRVAEFATAVAA